MIKFDNVIVEQNHFPDNSLSLKLLASSSAKIHTVDWHYENDAELFTIICIRKKYTDSKMYLRIPYLPHARMDRVKNHQDVFTLKYFCEVINSLNFTKVYVADVHSNVSLALLNNVVSMSAQPYIETLLHQLNNDNLTLFFPDEGAMKRYAEDNTGYTFAFGIKKRDWETGKILGLNIMQKENITGKDILIIDDICSKGGTFYHAAEALKEAGAKNIYLYITHCENTILKGKVFSSGLIDKVYTTDSLIHCDELKSKIEYVFPNYNRSF